ncbi:MAG TPA: FtsQ-type POTRA domain-containing protein [Kofleriaceae bacterium]|nr:FtsQ-type POTRA domain-containing protein [Kofleriaceae bacterium]
MDRSRRPGRTSVCPAPKEGSPTPPPASRLTLKPRQNRRRTTARGPLWTRVPKPGAIADACGRALRRGLPAIAAGAVALALGGTAWAGYHFVTTSPRFAITAIDVHGNRHLTADRIRAALPVHEGDNVFAADVEAALHALRADPWIEHAEAHRVLPDTLVIEVREHEAVALVDFGGLYLVDAAGHPFKRAELADGEGAGMPIVTGIDRGAYVASPDDAAALVQAALAALATWRADASRPAIGEVHVDAFHGLALHTFDPEIAIELGALDADLPARMRTFDAAWAELGDDERAHARAIHVDSRPDHVTVAFKDQ